MALPRGSCVLADPVMKRRLSSWLLVVSVLTLLATPVAILAARPPVEFGRLPKTSDPLSARSVVRAAIRDPAGSRSPVSGLMSKVGVRSARLDEYVPRTTGSRPVVLAIPGIGVRVHIVPVGVENGTGAIEVPPNVDTIGWYRFGPSPGVEGSAVLIGHVDSWLQGPGAFFRLRDLRPGDPVSVSFANGSTMPFRVVARRFYSKGSLPEMLFERRGRPILSLITCGGSFDQMTRSYSDNVVVIAVPR